MFEGTAWRSLTHEQQKNFKQIFLRGISENKISVWTDDSLPTNILDDLDYDTESQNYKLPEYLITNSNKSCLKNSIGSDQTSKFENMNLSLDN